MIDEHIADDGAVLRTHLDVAGDGLILSDDEGLQGALPAQAIVKVMRRYGRPLDDAVSVEGPALELDAGTRLQALSYRSPVDVEPTQYLVLHAPDEHPLVVISNQVAAALRYLVRQLHSRA